MEPVSGYVTFDQLRPFVERSGLLLGPSRPRPFEVSPYPEKLPVGTVVRDHSGNLLQVERSNGFVLSGTDAKGKPGVFRGTPGGPEIEVVAEPHGRLQRESVDRIVEGLLTEGLPPRSALRAGAVDLGQRVDFLILDCARLCDDLAAENLHPNADDLSVGLSYSLSRFRSIREQLAQIYAVARGVLSSAQEE